MQGHCAVTFVAHTAKRVARNVRRNFESKLGNVLAKDQFGFGRGIGNKGKI